MKDDDKKWLYIAGAGLLLTVILMNLKPKPTKKPPSLLGDGTGDGTGDTNPPDTNPPDTNPPVTQPPANPFPIMPAARASMLQKNLNFFLRHSTDPDTDSGSNLYANPNPVNGRFDKTTANTLMYLRPYWEAASKDWRGNLFMLAYFNSEEVFDISSNFPDSEAVKFAIDGTAESMRIRKSLYDQLTNFDLTAAREGFFPDYNDYDAAAFGDATE